MCVAVPGKVVAINGSRAVLSFMGIEKEVSVELIDDVSLGDYLIIHAGCAIQKLDSNEAEETIKLFEELKNS